MPGCDFQLPSFSVQMPGAGKTDMCCERCVFGRGEHEPWCSVFQSVAESLSNIDRLFERSTNVDGFTGEIR